MNRSSVILYVENPEEFYAEINLQLNQEDER